MFLLEKYKSTNVIKINIATKFSTGAWFVNSFHRREADSHRQIGHSIC